MRFFRPSELFLAGLLGRLILRSSVSAVFCSICPVVHSAPNNSTKVECRSRTKKHSPSTCFLDGSAAVPEANDCRCDSDVETWDKTLRKEMEQRRARNGRKWRPPGKMWALDAREGLSP